MLKLIVFFLIALSACVASSTKTASTTDASAQSIKQHAAANLEQAEIVELRYEQVTLFKNISLRVIDIQDSRCAIGVTCIWAGQIVVMLEVTPEKGSPEQIKLIRKRESEVIDVFGYSVRLLNIEPHPKKGQVIHLSEQVVQLEIETAESN